MKKPASRRFRCLFCQFIVASLLSGAWAQSATVNLSAASAAAGKGDPEAEFTLGDAYYKGVGEPKDDAQALNYFRLAAEQRNMKAENNRQRFSARY